VAYDRSTDPLAQWPTTDPPSHWLSGLPLIHRSTGSVAYYRSTEPLPHLLTLFVYKYEELSALPLYLALHRINSNYSLLATLQTK
jgi:hypothetical protein